MDRDTAELDRVTQSTGSGGGGATCRPRERGGAFFEYDRLLRYEVLEDGGVIQLNRFGVMRWRLASNYRRSLRRPALFRPVPNNYVADIQR